MCQVDIVNCAACSKGWAITETCDCGNPEEEALAWAERYAAANAVEVLRGSYERGVACTCGLVMNLAGRAGGDFTPWAHHSN